MPTTLLKLSCPDRVGLLSRISGWVAEQGGNLVEVHQFTDPHGGLEDLADRYPQT